jgi:aryl-alcohol dehydrogenase-like predicted oxidoreductase
MKQMIVAGVNFFDTAEAYGFGAAETCMGRALKELSEELKFKRKDICVTTKFYFSGKGVNDVGLSRKHIIESMRNSLKRLQMEYVDICYAHRPDYETPLEETVRAFSWCIDKGLSRYWGTSEWPAVRIEEAC